MTRKGARCVSCFAWVMSILFGVWTVSASAADGSGVSSISNEFWVGLFCTVLFGLVGAYVKGMERAMDKRLASLEFDFRQQGAQISLIRETMVRDHPTREETAEHRERVEEDIRYIRTRIDEMARGTRR